MNFATDLFGAQKMNGTGSEDPQTFPVSQPAAFHWEEKRDDEP